MDARLDTLQTRNHWWSGFFHKTKPPVVPVTQTSQRTPADSSLTQEDFLSSLPPRMLAPVFIEDDASRPLFAVMEHLLRLFYDLTPYLGDLTTSLKNDLLLCRDTYLQLRFEVEQLEQRPDYVIDALRAEKKSMLNKCYQADLAKYENELLTYTHEVVKARNGLSNLKRQIAQVQAEQNTDNLRELAIYQRSLSQPVVKDVLVEKEKIGCIPHFFHRSPSKQQAPLSETQPSGNDLRARLIELLNQELMQQEAALNHLIANKPLKMTEHRDQLLQLEAEVCADKAEHFHEITESMLLHFLHLQQGVDNALKAISEALTRASQTLSSDIQRFEGMQFVLQQVKDYLNDALPAYYCLRPGRYDYAYYKEQQDKGLKFNP